MEERNIKINKVLRELNISLERAMGYLNDKNIKIEASPYSKMTLSEYNILLREVIINNIINDIEINSGVKIKLKEENIELDGHQLQTNFFVLNSNNEIRKLNIYEAKISNLNFLEKYKKIEFLSLVSCELKEISILSNLYDLKSLNLATNDIGDYRVLKSLKNLFELHIADNTISHFDFLPEQLKELYLTDCYLDNIDFLKSSINLEILDLSYNVISDISPLKKLKKLKYLNLSNNEIIDISHLNEFKWFETLNLSANKIESIESLNGIEFKRDLFLSNNKIIDLSPLFTKLKEGKVNFINVLENPLMYPPKEYERYDEYQKWRWFEDRIDNARNIIKIFKSNNKKSLDLGNCGLTDLSLLPELFEIGEDIEELIISNHYSKYIEDGKYWEKVNSENNFYPNNIYNIPDQIKNLKNLKKLIIGGDWKKGEEWNRWRIKDIKPIFSLKKLEYLNVSNNLIEKIEVRTPPKLINLKVLHLNNNKLYTFYTLTKFPNLEELYLSNNELTTVNNLKNLIKLKTVDLHKNKITTLKPLLNILKKTNINITDTKWKKNTINIKDNPVKQPNFETILNGKEAIIRYFESEWGKIINKEVKLILVGNSEVGKTTLVKYLDGEKDLDKLHDATHWMIEKDVSSKKIVEKIKDKCNLRVFDFGGQDYYHDTHQIFFTGNTVYLLLWDIKTNNSEKRELVQEINGVKKTISTQDYPIEYWLESIKHFTKIKSNILDINNKITFEYDSKTLLIQNKVQIANEIFHLDNKELTSSEKYPFIYDFININIIKGKRNLEYFDFLLSEIINQMEKVGEEVLEYQHIIRKDLKHYNGKPILLLDEFIKYCNSKLNKQISFEEVEDLCSYLQHLGLIFYLKDSNVISKIYIDKVWVFECIYKILDGLFEKEGEFDEEYVQEIINVWKVFDDNNSFKNDIIDLMLSHKIIFKNPKAEKYIAPLYLPSEPIEGVSLFLLENRMPYRRFEFNGFIHKTFILDFYSKYGSKTISDGKKFYYWKNGLIIKDELTGQILHIKYNDINKVAKASVDIFKLNDSDKKNVFVSEVITFIKEINNKFFKINSKEIDEKRVDIEDYYEELVTVNNKDFVSYDLIQRNNEEKKYVFNERKMIDLKEKKIIINKNINLIDYKQFIENQDMLNKIFISYSKKDLSLVNVFQDHLSSLERDKLLNTWYCTELKPGEDWNESIQNHFNESNIICFMISPNFMKTNYIFEYEVKKAIERKKNGDNNFIIIPIIMDFCIWSSENENYNLGKYTALPYTAKPVFDFDNQNAAWLIIAECIKIIIKEKTQPEDDDFFSKNNYYNNTQLRDLFERLVKGELNRK